VLTGENIIILSSDDWASGLKTSKYHLARCLARENRVLFVNSIGLRSPGASRRDLGRIAKKLLDFCRGARRVPEGPYVYTPIAVPFRRNSRLVRAANALLLRFSLRWLQWRIGLKGPIVFAFIPTFNDVVGRLREKVIVYYCIDDLRGYAGVDADWFDAEERRLLERCDCVISSSRELHEWFSRRGWPSHYVPHGVDWSHFRRAVTEELPAPDDLKEIPRPRLGFYGFLSDEWVDYPLLNRVAREHPEWHIVLIGRPRAGMAMAEVVSEPNIHWLGLKPFESLPAYTRHLDVGLIPFRRNRLTLHSNPLKLLEYLSGGLPVVSTDIPEVRRYEEVIHIARTPDEFSAACGRALNETGRAARERRSRAAQAHTWEARVAEISRIVRRTLDSRRSLSTAELRAP